jgi:transcriptional regulator of acetoin/glycerol metabolism
MTIEEQLARLKIRAARLGGETAGHVDDNVRVLAQYLPYADGARVAAILLATYDLIETAEAKYGRSMPTDAEIIDAGRRFGVRAAARRLGISPTTVWRRLAGSVP